MRNAKKFYPILAVLLFCSILPLCAHGAFNDVTLTTSTVVSVGGINLTISGSSAVIQSIVVDVNSFQVTLLSGSSITVSSPTLNQISTDIQSDVVSNVCTGSASSLQLAYSGGGSVTNTITPSATICASTSNSNQSNVAASPAAGGSVSSGSAAYSEWVSLLPLWYQQELLAGKTVTSVQNTNSSSGPLTSGMLTSQFTRPLYYGLEGTDVKVLQEWLNAHGYIVAVSGTGSPGHENGVFGPATRKAVIKFQKDNDITPAVGTFGPLTRTTLLKLNN